MDYGKEFFGRHLIIKLRYKLTDQSLKAIQFAFPDLVTTPSLPEVANPQTSFWKLTGCIRDNEYATFNRVMSIAQERAKIADAEFQITQSKLAIDDMVAEYASVEDFDLNAMT